MLRPALLEEVRGLPATDRLAVMEAVWDSLDNDGAPVTPAEQRMLDTRLAEHCAVPMSGRPWNDVYSDLVRKYR